MAPTTPQTATLAGAAWASGPDAPVAGVTSDGLLTADGVVAVAVASPAPVRVSAAHGCRPRAFPAIVTRTEGCTVRELDGRPFDCAARRRAVGGRLREEAWAVACALATPAAGGLHTRGEVGRVRGAKGDLNHAVVVVAFA